MMRRHGGVAVTPQWSRRQRDRRRRGRESCRSAGAVHSAGSTQSLETRRATTAATFIYPFISCILLTRTSIATADTWQGDRCTHHDCECARVSSPCRLLSRALSTGHVTSRLAPITCHLDLSFLCLLFAIHITIYRVYWPL